MLTRSEVQQHSTRKSCWIIINGTVYDVTEFLDSHPGGSMIILKHAGRDATEAFNPIHSADTLEKHLTQQVLQSKRPKLKTAVPKLKKAKLSSIISITDFELAASRNLPPRSFAFIKTGAEDEYAVNWNRDCWKAIRFRPRILRPIENIDTSWSILGTKFAAPFFICPTGGANLAMPSGDVLLTKAAARHGILHWVCCNAGSTQQAIADARTPNQTTYWQIYAMSDLTVTEGEIKRAIELGYKGFALTVDAIRAGKRERDMRMSLSEDEDNDGDESFTRGPAVKRSPVWSSFDWVSAVKWLRGLTDLPITIKGIQCWEDAALCLHYGVHPWLSNHGGRQLDGAPSSLDTLVDIRKHCPEVLDKCEVIVDGGVNRGSDIVKAIAIGAKGAGLGRAFLYSLVFGEAGVDTSPLAHAFTRSHLNSSSIIMALPSAQPVKLTSNLTIQAPLSRLGHGPGLLILRPVIQSNTLNTQASLDPEPLQKWAEEGYVVAQLEVSDGHATIKEELRQAIDALVSHDKCSDKSKCGMIVYSPPSVSGLTEAIDGSGKIKAIVSYGVLPQLCKKPHVYHLAEKGMKSVAGNEVVYRYPEAQSVSFVLPSHKEFLSASAAVAHTRSLEFLKKQLDGPWFDLEAIWEEHTNFEFENRSVENTMSTMVQEPYVNHIPTITGGIGRQNLTSFYANHFIFNNPDDTELNLVSRTVGIDRVVDEFIFTFTHDKMVDWLIPGIPPTGKKLRIPFTSIVNIRGDRLYHEHIAWDQLTVLFQLGLMPKYLPIPYALPNGPKPETGKRLEYRVPGAGYETAEKLVNESAIPSNEMFKFAVNEASIQEAIADLKSQKKPNFSATAKKYGLERTTLAKRYKGQHTSMETAMSTHRQRLNNA
ncbi:hypothetical protein B7463_g5875, partial [Scytalidium lignicola]